MKKNTATTIREKQPRKELTYHYLIVAYPIEESEALTRTTIALYKAFLWFQRNKDHCWPGYKKLMKRAKIGSKQTISLHMKVLIHVGLLTKHRRGKMQSNDYQVVPFDSLTEQILKNLKRKHKYILQDIAKADEEKKRLRQAKQELKKKKLSPSKKRESLVPTVTTYPQPSEVHPVYAEEAFQASDISSKRNNNEESKEKSREGERGGGFKHIGAFLRPISGMVKLGPISHLETTKQREVDQEAFEKTAVVDPLQPVTDDKLEAVAKAVSFDAGNISQIKHIYSKARKMGFDEDGFIQLLYSARGLTREVQGLLHRPGAYFIAVLYDKIGIQSG